jgi:hypothetical protein
MRDQQPHLQWLDGAPWILYYGHVFSLRRTVANLIVPLALESGQT